VNLNPVRTAINWFENNKNVKRPLLSYISRYAVASFSRLAIVVTSPTAEFTYTTVDDECF
jgi:hypothetical protein